MLQKQVVSKGSLSMDHYFLCNYLPVTVAKDQLSRSLLRFKSRLEVDHQAWLECCLQELAPLVTGNFIIIRALHNSETIPVSSGLDAIGSQLAKNTGCNYHQDWLRKVHATKALKTLGRSERLTELKNVYKFKPESRVQGNQFLIIDDILTTGTTAFSIAQAIRDVDHDASIITFTLAKVDYNTHLNESLSFDNDIYHWERRKGWEVNEAEIEYNQLQKLKSKIMNDAF